MKRSRGNGFIFAGLLFIIAALFTVVYNIHDGVRADQSAQELVSRITIQMPEYSPVASNSVTSEICAEREMPTIKLDGYEYIGTLEIPSLNLSFAIMEEWSEDRLRMTPCRYSGSFYRDDMVIAGHNYGKHFSKIKSLPIDSEVVFTDVEGNVYEYTVSWMEIIKPEQVEEMVCKTKDAQWDLTLFTCTIGGGDRYTLRCIRRVKFE